MSQESLKLSLFCADSTPLQPKDLIFDTTYRNANEKKKFEQDRRFAYFNQLIKIRSQFQQNNKQVYNHVFGTESRLTKNSSSAAAGLSESRHSGSPHGRRVLHVEKINNYSFKVYKDRSVNSPSVQPTLRDFRVIKNIEFQIHQKRRKSERIDSNLNEVLSQYKKMQSTATVGKMPNTKNPNKNANIFNKQRPRITSQLLRFQPRLSNTSTSFFNV